MDRSNPRIAVRVTMVLAMLALATAAEAQRTSTSARKPATKPANQITTPDGRRTGFVLGVYTMGAPGLTVSGADIEDGPFKTDFGPGAGVMAGYGFNRTFAGYASVDVAKQSANDADLGGSFGLRHIELGARANLPLGTAATIPYVTGSYGGRSLAATATFDDGEATDVSLSGKYFGLGAGIEHAFSRTMAVDAGFDVGFGKFSHVKVGDDETNESVNPTRSIRMRLGVTWREGGGRTS
jgi:Outer membrane protein beta-barrel domain